MRKMKTVALTKHIPFLGSLALCMQFCLAPVSVQAEDSVEPRAATIVVAGLEVAMFSSNDRASISFASQADLLTTLDQANEISRIPEFQFLIIFAGDNLFLDGELSDDFGGFVGTSIRNKIDELEAPNEFCSRSAISFLDGTTGLIAFVDTSNLGGVDVASCVTGIFFEAWSETSTQKSANSFGQSIIDLIKLLGE